MTEKKILIGLQIMAILFLIVLMGMFVHHFLQVMDSPTTKNIPEKERYTLRVIDRRKVLIQGYRDSIVLTFSRPHKLDEGDEVNVELFK